MLRPFNPFLRKSKIAPMLAFFAVLVSTLLITSTYSTYSQTWDEAAHIACGMQWLSEGTYKYEALHPPLARLATALIPFLAGTRSQDKADMMAEGNALINLHGDYTKNLTMSRLGIMPFFWLVCFVVYRFMRDAFGSWYGATAVVLLAFCPPVLGNSALATTDAPLMAMFTWSFLRLCRFVQKPTLTNAALVGFVFALSALTKFTELPFFLLAAVLLLVSVTVRTRRFPLPIRPLFLAISIVPPVLWAGYHFSYGPIFPWDSIPPRTVAKLNSLSTREREFFTVTPVPGHEFFRGLLTAGTNGTLGRPSYLLGQNYWGRRWYFFPVALLVKTPIALLLLCGTGVGAIALNKRLRRDTNSIALLLGAGCPLLVGMAGNMNIGLRHVLPMFPFMAMLGALGAIQLGQMSRDRGESARRAAVLLLIGFEIVSCLRATPDFLPYFNEAAASHADYFLVNSDLDWGQDLFRLEARLRQVHASSVAISYNGDPHADLSGLPMHTALSGGDRPTGWIAISEMNYKEQPENFGWLAKYPYTLVGRSIRLYYLRPSHL